MNQVAFHLNIFWTYRNDLNIPIITQDDRHLLYIYIYDIFRWVHSLKDNIFTIHERISLIQGFVLGNGLILSPNFSEVRYVHIYTI